ncbi:MAG: hypothetical protein COT45_05905 [bacterium (Candidatus Stahlbacteria) CG08_land_8_20_14_0_20_40_26]|nr:MAG: hypothetical protein COX49_09920 [bacterium (Candidatus Stahlbacteria) CG23_combo_of_CG06-09_8_20_14_all_40_9]PIS23580.1 MAG: hypothetical protein COT45_05905 [bacterium (Candidatus Stahlbacteria) CG08_land_8_20_14_0_20_40_26]
MLIPFTDPVTQRLFEYPDLGSRRHKNTLEPSGPSSVYSAFSPSIPLHKTAVKIPNPDRICGNCDIAINAIHLTHLNMEKKNYAYSII